MMRDPANRLALTALAQNVIHDRWRTEAMRSHTSPRLLFIARGQGRITVAGQTRGYGANNLIFIPAKTMYGFELGPTASGLLITIPTAMATEWPDEPVHLRLRDVVAQKELIAHLDALERELESNSPGQDRAAHYQLGLLSIYFERQIALHEEDVLETQKGTPSSRLVAAYTDLIEQDFQSQNGVADYARKLGVTPTHLTRCCKETSGRSALALLNDRVFFEARLKLRDDTAPVCQIAKDLGFGSAAYFTRSFQNRTGMTPTDFRKKGPLAPF